MSILFGWNDYKTKKNQQCPGFEVVLIYDALLPYEDLQKWKMAGMSQEVQTYVENRKQLVTCHVARAFRFQE